LEYTRRFKTIELTKNLAYMRRKLKKENEEGLKRGRMK